MADMQYNSMSAEIRKMFYGANLAPRFVVAWDQTWSTDDDDLNGENEREEEFDTLAEAMGKVQELFEAVTEIGKEIAAKVEEEPAP